MACQYSEEMGCSNYGLSIAGHIGSMSLPETYSTMPRRTSRVAFLFCGEAIGAESWGLHIGETAVLSSTAGPGTSPRLHNIGSTFSFCGECLDIPSIGDHDSRTDEVEVSDIGEGLQGMTYAGPRQDSSKDSSSWPETGEQEEQYDNISRYRLMSCAKLLQQQAIHEANRNEFETLALRCIDDPDCAAEVLLALWEAWAAEVAELAAINEELNSPRCYCYVHPDECYV